MISLQHLPVGKAATLIMGQRLNQFALPLLHGFLPLCSCEERPTFCCCAATATIPQMMLLRLRHHCSWRLQTLTTAQAAEAAQSREQLAALEAETRKQVGTAVQPLPIHVLLAPGHCPTALRCLSLPTLSKAPCLTFDPCALVLPPFGQFPFVVERRSSLPGWFPVGMAQVAALEARLQSQVAAAQAAARAEMAAVVQQLAVIKAKHRAALAALAAQGAAAAAHASAAGGAAGHWAMLHRWRALSSWDCNCLERMIVRSVRCRGQQLDVLSPRGVLA